MHAERGFTLIEILVVVSIIGITLGFALLAFGDFGAGRRVIVNAEQFSSYLKLLQHQAVLANNTFGVSLNKAGYTTYRFEQTNWQPMPNKSILRFRDFPNHMTVTINTNTQSKLKRPDIVIDSAGNMTEFIASFGTEKTPELIRLIGHSDGQLKLQLPKAS